MFHITGIILSIFLASLLFTKKGKSAADLILGGWLILISLHLLAYYLLISGSYRQFPYLLGLEIPMPLLHGPFLYAYVASLTRQHYKRIPWWLHFLPGALAYLLLTGFYILPFDQKISVYENHGAGFEKLTSIIRMPIVPSGILYLTLALLLLRKHRINISQQFSYAEKINLNWLAYLTIGMAIIWLSVTFGGDVSTFLLVDLFVLFIGYFGIKQVGIFTNQHTESTSIDPPAEPIVPITADAHVKYKKTAVSGDQMTKIHASLSHLMQTENPSPNRN